VRIVAALVLAFAFAAGCGDDSSAPLSDLGATADAGAWPACAPGVDTGVACGVGPRVCSRPDVVCGCECGVWACGVQLTCDMAASPQTD
jgi:hypothetical protein